MILLKIRVLTALVAGVLAVGATAALAGRSSSAPVTCGEQTFPLSALSTAPREPRGHGRLSQAFRHYLRHQFGPEPKPRRGWRLLRRSPHRALFSFGQPPQMTSVMFARKPRGWRMETWSDACHLRRVRSGIQASAWWLDPRYPRPGRRARILHILVSERSCAGGHDARGRIQDAATAYGRGRVSIATYVTPRPGAQTCPGNPATPAIIRLSTALDGRKLYDAGFVPSHRRL